LKVRYIYIPNETKNYICVKVASFHEATEAPSHAALVAASHAATAASVHVASVHGWFQGCHLTYSTIQWFWNIKHCIAWKIPATRTPPAHEDSAVIFSSPAAASLGKLPSIAKPAARIDKLPFMDKSAAKIMGLKSILDNIFLPYMQIYICTAFFLRRWCVPLMLKTSLR
jgi:hypothetical protein